MTDYLADTALLPEGWADAVTISVAADGMISAVATATPPAGALRLAGPVVPGLPNLHSHAFQRALAGLAERVAPGDDFWVWRETMYRFLERLDPDDVEAIAAQLHVDLLRHGCTTIGEFHYLHHAPDGRPYADPAELSERMVAAAARSGIGLTLLPCLYAQGGFGGLAPTEGQRRFLGAPDYVLGLVESMRSRHPDDPQLSFGVAPHSLRAVTPDTLAALVAGAGTLPIHIHAAEQVKEVEACLAWSGARPVEWLLANAPVDARWCLVHATHMTAGETAGLAASGAVAGLCPTTEANLGDGLFPLPPFLAAGGRLGIGSDSQISTNPAEELRALDYAQRLAARRRGALGEAGHPGARLFRAAAEGGAQALGRPIGRIAPGARADLVVLEPEHPALVGRSGDLLLDAYVYVGGPTPVRDVMVGGRWVVLEGRHHAETAIAADYRRTMRRLLA